MQFNPDQNKQAQKLYFSKKAGNKKLLDLNFNKSNVASSPSVKQLGMLLDSRLNLNEHVQSKTNKCYKIIGLIKKLSIHLPREALLRIYKSFVRPNLDYGDIIFDKPNNESFKSRIESIQYKACVAITGAIQGTSRERLYRELGLESLSDRCWFRKLTFFYKIVKGLSPRYLTKYVNLKSTSNYQTRSANKNNLQEFSCRTESFKHSFFPFCVREWNKLGNTIRDAESVKQFKSMLKNFFSLNQRSLFSIHDPVGVKLPTRFWLQFSHLNEHKFRHNFKDCVSPKCDCGAETETTSHFFFRCQFFANERQKLRNEVCRLDASIEHLNEESLIDFQLYGSDRFNDSKNKQILLHTICYIQATKCFERPLIDLCSFSFNYYRCVFSLICLFNLYLQCNLLSYYFNLFTNFSFIERLYCRYQLLCAALHHKRICLT